jgi:glycosyltransferase involved in cell wall biosynthesis
VGKYPTMKFSLIIPCYNEAASLKQLLDRCGPVAAHEGCEVILVDNGSTDNTESILKALLPQFPGCRSIRVQINQGYGHGILCGLREAKGAILGWTHADLQTDPQDAIRALEIFRDDPGELFVKGRRYGRSMGDEFFTLGMSAFETILLGHCFWDINAQPTIFTKSFFDKWGESAPNDFSLDLFAYYMAKREKLKVKRFPVYFGKRVHGVSHWNIDWNSKRKFISRTIEFSLALRKKI